MSKLVSGRARARSSLCRPVMRPVMPPVSPSVVRPRPPLSARSRPAQAVAAALVSPLLLLALPAARAAVADEAVVVTATRSPAKLADLVAEVSVIDRATIERSEARTLVEVLAQAPGLQFTNNGGLGKSASLFIRGLEARHVLLLVDGVRVGSATLNIPSLDNLPLDAIERVEIVRGPMSALYGSNAMGGVVQVFTRKGSAAGLRANARVAAGSGRYALGSGGVSLGGAAWDLAAQVQLQRTEGFSATNAAAQFGSYNPDRDGFHQGAGSLRGGINLAPGWRLDGLLMDSRGVTRYDDGPTADARAALRNTVQNLQLAGTVLPGWQTQLSLGRSVDGYDTLAATYASSLGLTETDQRQMSWENRLALPTGPVRSQLLAVVERIEQHVSRPGTPYDVSRRDIDGLGLGYTGQLAAHDLQLSLRRDHDAQFGSKLTGAAGYAWRLGGGWRLGGSYGTSFTVPSFNQLYYPGFGNAALRPESGRHTELFGQWEAGAHKLRLTGFQHRYDLYISSGPQPANIPNVRIDGLTLAWDGRFDALALSASYDYADPVNASAGTSAFGKLLPRHARNALKAAADWQAGPFGVGAAVQAYDGRWDDSANTLHLGGYAVLDLHADWRFAPEWTLGLRVNNLADKAYATAWGYNQAGRQGFVTLRWAPR